MAAAYNPANNVEVAYGSATSISLTAMTRSAGDYLLVSLWIENSTKTPSTPSGWTAEGSAERSGKFEEFFFVRKADGTSTDNFSSSWTGAAGRMGEMRRITGAVSYSTGSANNGSSNKPTWKEATAANAEAVGIALFNSFDESWFLSEAPSGWTSDAKSWTPAVYRTLGKGATGEFQGTYSTSEEWVTKLFIFSPEAVVATNQVGMIL